MFSFFTELNRKRPPVELLDFVTFTTVAIFHAGDDRSAMEGLESLPYLAKSVEAFVAGKPFHVGPSAIGLRMNPYGEAPMANPGNIRQAMNGMDPRQRGQFGAAWSLGDHDKRRLLSDARASPPPIFGLMTNSMKVTLESST